MSEERAPITFHLEELRRRLIVCLVAWLLGSIISYIYAEDIIAVLSAPAGKLYFLKTAEVFFSYLEIAAFAGFIGTLPIHCYEFWRFLRPALRGGEVTTALWFIPSALILFYGGSAFAFFWVLPAAIQFFMGFATVSLQPMFSLSAYLSFFIAFLLPFALGFELPLVLLVLSRLGL
ncbi:twin-arginine translocase subunit TatC, partial [uncultured Megasphaera sp.]|uniref:twin-arginine translocase subunit TatC n=1 Tax=uncultured Megasphaera sp. TaxID=165188 RepID=UPI0025D37275